MTDTIYVRKDDRGVVRERVASTPADVVQLEFDGWTPKAAKPPTADKPADAKPAGK